MRPIRPQTVTLAVLAILFGLGAAWVAKQVLQAKHQVAVQPAPPPPEPRTPLLVLQSNLPADALIRDQDVGQVQEPLEVAKQRKIPDKAMKFKQQAVGRILKHAKPAASWLTEDDFYEIGKGPQLKLREGMRLVTVRIDDPAVSSSVFRSGCLVDVIFTAENPDDGSKLTKRLATGLEVLSPPVSAGGVPNSVMSVSGKSYISLAATPEQADHLALAQQLDGTISVSLAAVQDGSGGDNLDADRVNALLNRGDYRITERELLNLPPPAAPPERIVVEQIRGDKISYVVFTGDDERLSEAEARQNSLPAGVVSGTAAKPAGKKRCKSCEEAAKKAKQKANRGGGGASPVPDVQPSPTPAPRST